MNISNRILYWWASDLTLVVQIWLKPGSDPKENKFMIVKDFFIHYIFRFLFWIITKKPARIFYLYGFPNFRLIEVKVTSIQSDLLLNLRLSSIHSQFLHAAEQFFNLPSLSSASRIFLRNRSIIFLGARFDSHVNLLTDQKISGFSKCSC